MKALRHLTSAFGNHREPIKNILSAGGGFMVGKQCRILSAALILIICYAIRAGMIKKVRLKYRYLITLQVSNLRADNYAALRCIFRYLILSISGQFILWASQLAAGFINHLTLQVSNPFRSKIYFKCTEKSDYDFHLELT